MDKKLDKIQKNLIPTKLSNILYSTNYCNTIKHKHTFNWPAFLGVNNGSCTSSDALIRMQY